MQKHMSTGTKSLSSSLEIWGGIECTINRVEEEYFDQLQLSGFNESEEYLQQIISLGIKVLRFPVLWEQHQPDQEKQIDWTRTSKQLDLLRHNGIEPIAGLIHHGSGPSYTNLLEPCFPEKLADYARKVAEKFPWIRYYTPVNEPLTTARFSGLYGIWYPHKESECDFLKMLINQLKAVVLSMKVIREINPSAMLVQTEDLGKTYSTPLLSYQANFENQRRWLTNDLLCGKVNSNHSFYNYLLQHGISLEELNFFIDNSCVPDILGYNHYVTSERYLDEKLFLYPEHLHGGNGIHQYVDTEAVRVPHDHACGLKNLLTEAWDRYHLPMAMTEVHLHCTREEQLRWFMHIYEECKMLLKNGIDIRAVTAWSLFGAFGWNKLLTVKEGDYESGVFDLRTRTGRPTALAKMIRTIIEQDRYQHPLLISKGWWQRDIRFLYGEDNLKEMSYTNLNHTHPPLLIIGRTGTLGSAFARLCELRGIPYKLLGRQEFDLGNKQMMEQAIGYYKPWAIVNAAGFVRVDDAEVEVSKCFSANTQGPVQLALSCREKGIKLVSFSSDLVFDGKKDNPYIESDLTSPLNVYGQSKADKEKLVTEIFPESLIIRTSSFFGPWDQYNFIHHVLNNLSNHNEFEAVDDVYMSPTYVPDLVNFALDLLIDEESGIWHLTNEGAVSWFDLAREAASRAGLNTKLVRSKRLSEMNWKAARPLYSVLKSSKGTYLPTLENALQRYFTEKAHHGIAIAV